MSVSRTWELAEEHKTRFDRQWRLTLYVNWLLAVLLAGVSVVLLLHVLDERHVTYEFEGCFAGSAAAEEAVVVTYGTHGCEQEAEK
jgi:hypothetical protein